MDRRSFLALSGSAALAATLKSGPLFAEENIGELYQQAMVIDASGEAADFTEGFPIAEKSLKAAGESGLTAINWTVSMPMYEATVSYIGFVQQIAETHPTQFLLVRKQTDLAAAKKDKKVGLIFAFQHPQPFDSDLDRITTFRRQAAGTRMAHPRAHDRDLLSRPSPRRIVPGMPGFAGLCLRAARSMPIRRGEADLRPLSGALLSEGAPRPGARRHAVRRSAHALGASRSELAALGRRLAVGRFR